MFNCTEGFSYRVFSQISQTPSSINSISERYALSLLSNFSRETSCSVQLVRFISQKSYNVAASHSGTVSSTCGRISRKQVQCDLRRYAKSMVLELSSTNGIFPDLDKCKQFNAVNGYNYEAFFKLSELDNHNLDNETIVNLRLFVVASKDAHILLSDINSVIPEAQVYEIG